MEIERGKILSKVLSEDELTKIPAKILKKLELHFEERFEEFITSKALCETAKSTIDQIKEEFEKQIADLKSKLQDDDAKLSSSEQSVEELRLQLDKSQTEVHKFQETLKRFETETSEYRKERNEAVDERDSLLKMVDRRNVEVERLQQDILQLENQLTAAINVKCEALNKLDEIQSKENSLDFKEKRMEQEKLILTNQIQSLTDDLNRNINELQTIRRDNTLRSLTLDTKLTEKTEELKIANNTILHLTETNNSLIAKAEDLTEKLRSTSEDTGKMMNHYKKELQSANRLADLYKENDDDHSSQINELTSAIVELKKMLNDATEQYGVLETKSKGLTMKFEEELEAKDVVIQSIREELKNASDILKASQQENLNHAVESLAPTAAATSRMIKSGMSLTEIYSMYVKTTEELQIEKRDNLRLNNQMQTIFNELEAKAPEFQKLRAEHNHLAESNQELSQQLQAMINQRIEERDAISDTNAKLSYMERENKNLKIGQSDLARQVCFLLKEIEQVRGGFSSEHDQSISSDMSARDVITKKLVTFSDIQELQENNERLLLLVRDLSTKLEEMEGVQNSMEQACYETKLASYTKRLKELEETQDNQTKMLSNCMQQKDRYKKLYYDSLKGLIRRDNSFNGDAMEEEDTPLASSSNVSISNETIAGKDKKISDLEEQIKETKESIKTLKEEYETYRKEKQTNDKMSNEQFDSMRTELREMTSANCKLMSTAEYNTEQIKIQQKNAATYKKQIEALEDRNKNYEKTISKYEQAMNQMRDETLREHTKSARTDVLLQNLQQELRVVKDSESRLQLEREFMNRERQNQNLLLNNLEMIKANFERSDTEGRIRMEERLDEATRECSALRRRLQEEQDRFRELTTHLERQTETAKQRMEAEIVEAEKLRTDLSATRDELIEKTKQIEELSKKLQESLAPSKNDNPISQANKRVKELELLLSESKIEVESLMKSLEISKEHVKQYCDLSESSEKQLKDISERFTTYQTKMEEDLKNSQRNELIYKTKVEEMETEISLQITGAQLTAGDSNSQLHKAQSELKDALQKLSENNRELRENREQINILSGNLQMAEQKYANEMVQHSTDIQAMSSLKEQLQKVCDSISELKGQRDQALAALDEMKNGTKEMEVLLKTEKDELENRLLDMDKQNSALHDQIQTLSTKLSISSHQDVDVSMTESIGDSSLVNRSINEGDVKSSDQLLQIIKYLRKEKDIAIAKVDILKSETIRLQSEQNVIQKRCDEALATLVEERSKSEVGVVTAAKHDELLRRVETLNAITDSNRSLREERDNLSIKVKELSERVNKVEDELYPLQDKNRELLAKSESAAAENTSLRVEATRWRQRANLLVERSNKASPEDFKRLQAERENLTKLLLVEKETLKKISDELTSIKTDKQRLESNCAQLQQQLQTSSADNKKVNDEIVVLRLSNTKMTQEIMEMKNLILTKEDELKKVTDDLAVKDAQIIDIRQKELQIRKIAKKYKDLNTELMKQNEIREGEKIDANPEAGPSDKLLGDKMIELNNQLTVAKDELEKVQKDHDRNKQLIAEAKNRIKKDNETHASIVTELTAAKTKIQLIEQSRDEHELRVTGLKSQFETRIARLEKELSDQDKDKQDTITRLQRENENLLLRVTQLQRQMGLQQGSKPSTSSGSSEKNPTDTPRTANVKPQPSSAQQSATVQPWRGSETPLASIRPISVQNSRTAAVLPTSQTSNVATVQGSSSGSSSSSSVTALVPPQQQVHTTGNNSAEVMSSSPTSSHTDYMPATSSAAVVVAAVVPMGSSTPAESSQEAESESSSSQVVQQQAVALVSPRIEGTPQNIVPPQSPQVSEPAAASSSVTVPAAATMSSHHPSSSNTVTTTQAGGHKRPRDADSGESSTGNVEESTEKSQPQSKRTRTQVGEAFQGVSESGIDVEYQVPTSSQRDQEDDIIVVDSEEDDEGMVDEGTAEADDGPFEDDADNGDAYEMEESYEQEQEMAGYDEGEGPDIDEDNPQLDNNEVEVDDSSEVPNQSVPDAGPSTAVSSETAEEPIVSAQNQEVQQIQTISSGSDAGSSTPSTPSQTHTTSNQWRTATPMSRQPQSHLMLVQQGYNEETGDDGIVPSTPTLYTSRRTDGFSEAVSSPHPQAPPRFTFSDSAGQCRVAESGMDDTRIDLSQLDESRTVPSTPQQNSPQAVGESSEITPATTTLIFDGTCVVVGEEQVAGTSDELLPEVVVTDTSQEEDSINEMDDGATTSDAADDDKDKESSDVTEMDEEGEGTDGVSSEGEKATGTEGIEMEESREAEATEATTSNTRVTRATLRGTPNRRNFRGPRGSSNRPTPITWGENTRGHSGGRGYSRGGQQNQDGSPNRHPTSPFQPQRAQRGKRVRRSNGPNYNTHY